MIIQIEKIEKIEKLQKLATSIQAKGKFFRQKAHRAIKRENMYKNFEKAEVYDFFEKRASDFFWLIKTNKKLASPNLYQHTPEEYKKMRAEIKQERKAKFDSTYRVALHFFQTSLCADYGKFVCEHCKTTFYHSPSEMYLGKDKHFDCICGHCVNDKMRGNGQEEIFN